MRDERRRGIGLALGVVLLLALLLLLDQLRLTLGFMRHWANEDITLLWYGARDVARFRFPQPNSYGASYYTMYEAFPAGLLNALGVRLGTSVTLATATCAIVGWIGLASAAWWRGHRVLAAAALAFPVIVRFEYLIDIERPAGRAAGMVCAMLGVAALVANPTRTRNLFVFVLLGTLGVVWDFGSAFLIVPAGLFALVVNFRNWRALGIAASGAIPGAAWMLYARNFNKSHPDYDLHKGVGFTPGLSNLQHSLPHPTRYFGWQAPELVRWVGIPLIAAACLLLALLWTRRLRAILPAGALVVMVIATLAMPKAFDGTSSVYLGFARYFYALSPAAWFLAYVLSEARPLPHWNSRRARQVLIAIAAVTMVSFVVKQVTFDHRMASIVAVAEKPTAGAPVFPTSDMYKKCNTVRDVARRAATKLAVFRYDRPGAYACAGLAYGDLETIHPEYERRAWLLHQEQTRPRTSFVITEVDEQWCERARRVAGVQSCEIDPSAPGIAVVRTAALPPLVVLRRMGEKIRPFQITAH